MKGKSEDRGVRKTKKALRESLGVLLETKKMEDITIKELTELADVNRGTFYYHYEDIYQLQHEIERELLSGLEDMLDNYEKTDNTESFENLFLVLLHYILDNAMMFRILLGSARSGIFIREIEKRLIEDWNFSMITRNISKGANPEERAYYVHFLTSGFVAVITHWLESGLKEPPETMAAIMNRINVAFYE